MPERGGFPPPELPEPHDLITRLAEELGLDPQKKPVLEEKYSEKQLYPEEAPTSDGRYLALSCLENIYSVVMWHTPPGAPILLSKGDVRWIHQDFRHTVEEAWFLPDPCPDVTLTHVLGAAKRQLAHLEELKRFHESSAFDPALRTLSQIAFVTERAILDGDPSPEDLGEGGPT